jgi:hypothetical protein
MQSLEDLPELLVMLVQPSRHLSLEIRQPILECRIGTGDATKLNECPHDLDVDRDRPIAPQNSGEHRDALLSEDERSLPATTVPAT